MNFVSRLPQMLQMLKKFVETESPSEEKELVNRMGALVAEECLRLGAALETFPNPSRGDHLVARWNASAPGKPILLMHHMDTVFPAGTIETMPFRTDSQKTYGPGVLDMKGGIVISLAAIAALQEAGQFTRPVTALFTSDEEVGSGTSRGLIERLAAQASLVLVLESGLVDGSLKTWRKGVGDFRVAVHGRAAHSGGEHEKGRNAIRELAKQILEIETWSDYARGTTVNVGVVRGGTAENVVPAFAEARGDIRVTQPAEAERILASLFALQPAFADTRLEVRAEMNRPAMPQDDLMLATFAKARQIAAGIGQDLKAGGSGGASDANFVSPLGVPVLDGLGSAGADYHSEREWIYTDSLAERAALIAALLREWDD